MRDPTPEEGDRVEPTPELEEGVNAEPTPELEEDVKVEPGEDPGQVDVTGGKRKRTDDGQSVKRVKTETCVKTEPE